MKSKTTAALLAFFLGGIGGHKFYLGRTGQGLLYLFFCWTFIPAAIAFIEFILLLVMSDAEFNAKYNVGLVPVAAAPTVINVQNTVSATNTPASGHSPAVAIRELHELKLAGAITEAEYEAQKQKLLAGA